MTNFDRIKAMTEDEMAQFIFDMTDKNSKLLKAVKDWLKTNCSKEIYKQKKFLNY